MTYLSDKLEYLGVSNKTGFHMYKCLVPVFTRDIVEDGTVKISYYYSDIANTQSSDVGFNKLNTSKTETCRPGSTFACNKKLFRAPSVSKRKQLEMIGLFVYKEADDYTIFRCIVDDLTYQAVTTIVERVSSRSSYPDTFINKTQLILFNNKSFLRKESIPVNNFVAILNVHLRDIDDKYTPEVQELSKQVAKDYIKKGLHRKEEMK